MKKNGRIILMFIWTFTSFICYQLIASYLRQVVRSAKPRVFGPPTLKSLGLPGRCSRFVPTGFSVPDLHNQEHPTVAMIFLNFMSESIDVKYCFSSRTSLRRGPDPNVAAVHNTLCKLSEISAELSYY